MQLCAGTNLTHGRPLGRKAEAREQWEHAQHCLSLRTAVWNLSDHFSANCKLSLWMRVASIVYLEYRNVFDTASNNILVVKLARF